MRKQLRPKWQDHNKHIPESISAWLLHKSSMTKKLRAITKQEFNVNVLFHGRKKARVDERNFLNISKDEPVIVREVELSCDQNVCIYARSVFPLSSLTEKYSEIKNLGNKPLGDVIFNDPNLQREPFQIACLGPGHIDFAKAVRTLNQAPDELWARRSIFRLDDKPILVTEIFLPTLFSQ